jgi:hypothetical protein
MRDSGTAHGLDHLDGHRRSSGRPLRGNDHVVTVKAKDPVRPSRDSRDFLSRERLKNGSSIRVRMHACQSPARVRQSGPRNVPRACVEFASVFMIIFSIVLIRQETTHIYLTQTLQVRST